MADTENNIVIDEAVEVEEKDQPIRPQVFDWRVVLGLFVVWGCLYLVSMAERISREQATHANIEQQLDADFAPEPLLPNQ